MCTSGQSNKEIKGLLENKHQEQNNNSSSITKPKSYNNITAKNAAKKPSKGDQYYDETCKLKEPITRPGI